MVNYVIRGQWLLQHGRSELRQTDNNIFGREHREYMKRCRPGIKMGCILRTIVYAVIVWTLCVVFFLFISVSITDKKHLSLSERIHQSDLVYQKYFNVTSPTKSQDKLKQDWLKNFYHRKGRLSSKEVAKMGVAEPSADYLITETGKVKIFVVNKTIKSAGEKPEPENNLYNDNLKQTLRLRREHNERRYFTPRKKIVNPINTDFIITGAQICSTDAKYMTILIIVPSIPSHNFVRDTIRTTYGSYSKRPFHIEHTAIEVTVRLLFLVGKDENIESSRMIRNESRLHGDMVFADFMESYRNLTRKMLIALKWISVYCSDIDFVLKVDEDVFVNIPRLAEELHRRPYGIKGAVYGYINPHSAVHRAGKWSVSVDEYPLTYYPQYASGNSYVISGNIIPRMFMISEYLPYMPIEDAFITGCLARIVEAKVTFVQGFTYWNDPAPDPCQFVKKRRISATKVTTSIMEKLWKTCNNYLETCTKRQLLTSQ